MARWVRSLASKGIATVGENRPFFAGLFLRPLRVWTLPRFADPFFRAPLAGCRSISRRQSRAHSAKRTTAGLLLQYDTNSLVHDGYR